LSACFRESSVELSAGCAGIYNGVSVEGLRTRQLI
jgi:hypothetical protein